MGQWNSKIDNEIWRQNQRKKTVIKAHFEVIEENEDGLGTTINKKNQYKELIQLDQPIKVHSYTNAKSQVFQENDKQNYAFYTSRGPKTKEKVSLTCLSKSHLLSYDCWLQETQRQIEAIQQSKSQLVSIEIINTGSVEEKGRKQEITQQISVIPITIDLRPNLELKKSKDFKHKKRGKVNLNPIHKQLKRVYAV